MRVSIKWLQTYFDKQLPSVEKVADAFTFHAFEVEEVEGDMLDLNVLPDRAGYALSHRGIAHELSAILDIPMKIDQLRIQAPRYEHACSELNVKIENEAVCSRYAGAVVRGVRVGSSPDWLRAALESIGQRSINNIVDATNYVMFDLGQPLHAFDADKLAKENNAYRIAVRNSRTGESITTLSGDEYLLHDGTLLITDDIADVPLGVAGVKGGKAAEVTRDTTDIVVESANFSGTIVRRSAQALKLFTDASLRFQNRPSPELAGYGMRAVLDLIVKVAGGEVVGVTDWYAHPPKSKTISVTPARVNDLLGSTFTPAEIVGTLHRLGLITRVAGEEVVVEVPFERTDLTISEDVAEEVGRILGYDQVPAIELPSTADKPEQAQYRGVERMKDELVAQGYVEVSTQSFAKKGDIELANPLDKRKPFLRTSLAENLDDALTRAKRAAPRVLTPGQKPKLFEVGTVFPKEGEYVELRMTERVSSWGDAANITHNLSGENLADYGRDYEPVRLALGPFTPYSAYPFVARDIAFWAPVEIDEAITKSLIREHAGDLLVKLDQFDRFEKDGRVSYAYRLIFESLERTLTDDDVNKIIERISTTLAAHGYEVR